MTTSNGHSGLAIDLGHVSKTYRGKVQALRGIEMHVNRGEVFGLLGPNGAGKTTLVKILMTVTRASRCEGTLLGRSVGDKATLGRVGYLPEHHRFPEYLTARQVLDYFGAMAVVPRTTRRKRVEELLTTVGLKDWAGKRVKSFSKGMRQRLGVAQALINDPDLVLLDEPTDGVDPVGRREIRAIVTGLKEQGKTVFLNSHLLSELEMVCDRVAILVRGVVSSQGTLDELTRGQRRYEIELAVEPQMPGADVARLLPESVVSDLPRAESNMPVQSHGHATRVGWSGHLASGEPVEIERNMIRVGTDDAEIVQPLIDGLRRRGAVIRSLRPVRPSLEDLFIRAVTDPATGEVLQPGADMDAKRRGGP